MTESALLLLIIICRWNAVDITLFGTRIKWKFCFLKRRTLTPFHSVSNEIVYDSWEKRMKSSESRSERYSSIWWVDLCFNWIRDEWNNAKNKEANHGVLSLSLCISLSVSLHLFVCRSIVIVLLLFFLGEIAIEPSHFVHSSIDFPRHPAQLYVIQFQPKRNLYCFISLHITICAEVWWVCTMHAFVNYSNTANYIHLLRS